MSVLYGFALKWNWMKNNITWYDTIWSILSGKKNDLWKFELCCHRFALKSIIINSPMEMLNVLTRFIARNHIQFISRDLSSDMGFVMGKKEVVNLYICNIWVFISILLYTRHSHHLQFNEQQNVCSIPTHHDTSYRVLYGIAHRWIGNYHHIYMRM